MAAMHDSTFLDSRDFARIARAIRYIDANFRTQPRLAAIAAQARLSEFHFNRLFRRWAGITPKQYLGFVTARAARAALASTPSVLEASFAVGLSGPSRLHDLIVTLDGVTPGELKGGGFGLRLDCGFSDTPFGRALLASTARGVSHLSFVDPGEASAPPSRSSRRSGRRRSSRRDDEAAAALAARIWDAPARAAAPLRLAVRGTNFQLKVWQALLETRATGPTSYQALAGAAGVAGGARAVGNAVGSNPVAWLIPCHNVLHEGRHARAAIAGGPNASAPCSPGRPCTRRPRAASVWSRPPLPEGHPLRHNRVRPASTYAGPASRDVRRQTLVI